MSFGECFWRKVKCEKDTQKWVSGGSYCFGGLEFSVDVLDFCEEGYKL